MPFTLTERPRDIAGAIISLFQLNSAILFVQKWLADFQRIKTLHLNQWHALEIYLDTK